MSKLETRLEIGNEVIYFDGNTLMELTTVVAVDKKEKTATLANNIKVDRYPNKEQYYPRIDAKRKSEYRTWTKEYAQGMFDAYKAKNRLIRLIPELFKQVQRSSFLDPVESQFLIKFNNKVDKLWKSGVPGK